MSATRKFMSCSLSRTAHSQVAKLGISIQIFCSSFILICLPCPFICSYVHQHGLDDFAEGDPSSDAATSPAQKLQTSSPISYLLERTGYPLVQQNGQRRYGPPPTWDGSPPPRGSEVFVGKIPRDCFEDELVPVFEQVGVIYEIRLMMDHYSDLNRGYAFVVFSTAGEAKECVKRLNNYEIRQGRTLGICMSVDNCRLFIGGIPKKVYDTAVHLWLELMKAIPRFSALPKCQLYSLSSDNSMLVHTIAHHRFLVLYLVFEVSVLDIILYVPCSKKKKNYLVIRSYSTILLCLCDVACYIMITVPIIHCRQQWSIINSIKTCYIPIIQLFFSVVPCCI